MRLNVGNGMKLLHDARVSLFYVCSSVHFSLPYCVCFSTVVTQWAVPSVLFFSFERSVSFRVLLPPMRFAIALFVLLFHHFFHFEPCARVQVLRPLPSVWCDFHVLPCNPFPIRGYRLCGQTSRSCFASAPFPEYTLGGAAGCVPSSLGSFECGDSGPELTRLNTTKNSSAVKSSVARWENKSFSNFLTWLRLG